MPAERLILASASPRREKLLREAGYDFEVVAANVDESEFSLGAMPSSVASRLAQAKAEAVAAHNPDAVVLAADTVVAVGRRLLEKPADEAEATRFLTLLSGRNHRVFTGVAVACGDRIISRVVDTRVSFKVLSPPEIADYVAGGDWRGKAGGYGIQGPAGAFVTRIVGSYPAVMGLPLFETVNLLSGAGWRRSAS